MITGNVIGGLIKTPETIILVDDEGNEYPAVSNGEEVELTATVNDVRLGKVAALTKGVKTGEKEIPLYNTREGLAIIPDGCIYRITSLKHLDLYDYTKIQIIICDLNTTPSDSVSAHKVSINENLYETESTLSIGIVSRDHNNKNIDFGLMNNTGKIQIVRFFMYKEIY